MPQGMLSLNVENGATIIAMVLLIYLGGALLFSLLMRGFGGGGQPAGSNAVLPVNPMGMAMTTPTLSWQTDFNLAA